jgi:hypothetical protein
MVQTTHAQVEVQCTAEAQDAMHSTLSETDINSTHSSDDAQNEAEGSRVDLFDDTPPQKIKPLSSAISLPGRNISAPKRANIGGSMGVETDNGSVKSNESGMTTNTNISTVVNSLRSNLIDQSTSVRLGSMFARPMKDHCTCGPALPCDPRGADNVVGWIPADCG